MSTPPPRERNHEDVLAMLAEDDREIMLRHIASLSKKPEMRPKHTPHERSDTFLRLQSLPFDSRVGALEAVLKAGVIPADFPQCVALMPAAYFENPYMYSAHQTFIQAARLSPLHPLTGTPKHSDKPGSLRQHILDHELPCPLASSSADPC